MTSEKDVSFGSGVSDDRAKSIGVVLILAPVPLVFLPGVPWWVGVLGCPLALAWARWWSQ